MAGPTDTRPLEPQTPAEPAAPPIRYTSPGDWARANLFNSWPNVVLTIVFAALFAWAVFSLGRFVFFTGRWDIVQANLTNYMVGRFPRDELYRPWIAILLVSFVSGLGTGFAARQIDIGWRERIRRIWPVLLFVVVVLSFTQTVVPTLLVLVSLAAAVGGRLVGLRLPDRAGRWMNVVYVATVFGVFSAFTGFGGVGWGAWGGLLLTLFLAIGGIVLSFPLGVALALGRRSTFPIVRVVCVAYIELIRGVPLITLLFMGEFMLGFFFPPGFPTPESVTRALIALTLFTAAYVAEIVRGGLQGVPKGQFEAAQAIGLSPVKMTLLIVLPQALRNVIPALVGQFISLFKDTSLVYIIGQLDLLRVARVVTQQPEFRGQGYVAESLLFVAFIYWVFCYTMSRSSQRLEQRLGVGQR